MHHLFMQTTPRSTIPVRLGTSRVFHALSVEKSTDRNAVTLCGRDLAWGATHTDKHGSTVSCFDCCRALRSLPLSKVLEMAAVSQ